VNDSSVLSIVYVAGFCSGDPAASGCLSL